MPLLASVDEPLLLFMPLLVEPLPVVLLRRAGSLLPMLPDVLPALPPGGVLPALLVLIVPLLVALPGVVVGPGVGLGVVLLVLGTVLGLASRPGVVVVVLPLVPGVTVLDCAPVLPWLPVVLLLPGLAVLPVPVCA
jgi:hypothetical protein